MSHESETDPEIISHTEEECKCQFRCRELTPNHRRMLNALYVTLSDEEQGTYLLNQMDLTPVRRRRNGIYGNCEHSRRQVTFVYYVPGAASNIQVCLRTFREIFKVRKGRMQTLQTKKKQGATVYTDCRGSRRHPYGDEYVLSSVVEPLIEQQTPDDKTRVNVKTEKRVRKSHIQALQMRKKQDAAVNTDCNDSRGIVAGDNFMDEEYVLSSTVEPLIEIQSQEQEKSKDALKAKTQLNAEKRVRKTRIETLKTKKQQDAKIYTVCKDNRCLGSVDIEDKVIYMDEKYELSSVADPLVEMLPPEQQHNKDVLKTRKSHKQTQHTSEEQDTAINTDSCIIDPIVGDVYQDDKYELSSSVKPMIEVTSLVCLKQKFKDKIRIKVKTELNTEKRVKKSSIKTFKTKKQQDEIEYADCKDSRRRGSVSVAARDFHTDNDDSTPEESLIEVMPRLVTASDNLRVKVETELHDETIVSNQEPLCKCPFRCRELSSLLKEALLTEYCELTNAQRGTYLLDKMELVPVKRRRYGAAAHSRRQATFRYMLPVANNEQLQVCLRTFMEVFEITVAHVHTLQAKKKQGAVLYIDMRGSSTASQKHNRKYSEEDRARIVGHINSFPRRATTDSCEFLSATLNRHRLYLDYEKHYGSHHPITYQFYVKVLKAEFPQLGFLSSVQSPPSAESTLQ